MNSASLDCLLCYVDIGSEEENFFCLFQCLSCPLCNWIRRPEQLIERLCDIELLVRNQVQFQSTMTCRQKNMCILEAVDKICEQDHKKVARFFEVLETVDEVKPIMEAILSLTSEASKMHSDVIINLLFIIVGSDRVERLKEMYKARGGAVNFRAIKWLFVGPSRVGKTTTKDRLLGKYENIDSSMGMRSGSTGFETPVEVSLNSTPIFDRSATIIGMHGRKQSWKACNVNEQATFVLSSVANTPTSGDSEGGLPVFTIEIPSLHEEIDEEEPKCMHGALFQNISATTNHEEADTSADIPTPAMAHQSEDEDVDHESSDQNESASPQLEPPQYDQSQDVDVGPLQSNQEVTFEIFLTDPDAENENVGKHEEALDFADEPEEAVAVTVSRQNSTPSKPSGTLEEVAIRKENFQRRSVSYEETDALIAEISKNLVPLGKGDSMGCATTVYMLDTGGQPEFLDILPLILRGPAFYMIFFSLAHSLSDCYKVKYIHENESEEKSYDYDSEYTVVHILSRLVNTFSHLDFINRCNAPYFESKAFLFGTCADEADLDTLRSVDSTLRDVFSHQGSILTDARKDRSLEFDTIYIPVNNKTGTHSEITNMQNYLSKFVERIKPIKLPTNWLLFHFVLRTSCEKNKLQEVSQLDKVVELAGKCGIEREHVKIVLTYIHENLGTILYFEDIPGLNDIVICNPEVLFRFLSKLIASVFDQNSKVYRNGELHEAAFHQIFEQTRVNELMKMEYIVELLKHYKIITRITEKESNIYDATTNVVYIMPSLLRPDISIPLHPTTQDIDKNALIICFPCSSGVQNKWLVPVGVHTALAVELHSLERKSNNDQDSMKQPWEFIRKGRNKNRLSFQAYGCYVAEITVRSSHLEVTCKLGSETAPTVPHIKKLIQEDIKIALKNITQLYKYPNPEFRLYCCYEEYWHLVRYNERDRLLMCDDDDCGSGMMVKASIEQMKWFQDSQQVCLL